MCLDHELSRLWTCVECCWNYMLILAQDAFSQNPNPEIPDHHCNTCQEELGPPCLGYFEGPPEGTALCWD